MIIANKTTFTSDPIFIQGWNNGRKEVDIAIRGDLGASGVVKILILSEDGNYYDYANLAFTELKFYTVSLPVGHIKVDISGAVDVTVEVN